MGAGRVCARLSSVLRVSHKRSWPAGRRALTALQPAAVPGRMPPIDPGPGKLALGLPVAVPGEGSPRAARGPRPGASRLVPASPRRRSPHFRSLLRSAAGCRASPCSRACEFVSGWNPARAAAPGASARTEQGQAAGSAAGTRRAQGGLEPARGELTFRRPPRAEFFQFLLVVVHVVLKQMHRTVAAAFRHVLESVSSLNLHFWNQAFVDISNPSAKKMFMALTLLHQRKV